VIFDQFDVVISAFPFVEVPGGVKRPVLVLSKFDRFGSETGIGLTAMVTTAKNSAWPFDVPVADLEIAGLRQPCFIRMKFGSIAFERVDRKIGVLSERDRAAVRKSLQSVLGGAI
jgi:mRNA interferase MazF